MLLPELPNEILFLVAEHTPHLRDLNALARANRRLHHCLNGWLYRRDVQLGSLALFWAARKGMLSTARNSVAAGTSLRSRSRDRTQNTPVLEAAHYGNLDVLDFLLSHPEADINAQDRWGQTPLINAVRNEDEATVKRLLCYPELEPDKTDDSTTYKHHPGGLRVDRPYSDIVGGMTALAHAACQDNGSLVQLLLQIKGIDPNSKDCIGRTPLFHAINYNREEVVKQLLAHPDVELNPRDRANNTPLSYAAYHGLKPIVSLLLRSDGIELDAANDDGKTPLHLAEAQLHKEVVKLLSARGAAPSQ